MQGEWGDAKGSSRTDGNQPAAVKRHDDGAQKYSTDGRTGFDAPGDHENPAGEEKERLTGERASVRPG